MIGEEEAIELVKKEIRDNGFTEADISDDFIEGWGDFYYDNYPGDLFEIYEGIMYEYNLATES